MASSVTAWIDAAMSISRSVIGDSGARRGPPNSVSNLRDAIFRPVAVREVLHVEAERAVGAQVQEVIADAIRVLRLTVREPGPISLYSPELTLKPVNQVNAE